MPNGRNGGKWRNRRQKQNKNEKGGRTVVTAAPALFAFIGSVSSFVGLSASRWAFAPLRFGNGCFRIGQRKPIIRTHLLSEKGSDYMGLVPLTGVEPVRYRYRGILSPLCLPYTIVYHTPAIKSRPARKKKGTSACFAIRKQPAQATRLPNPHCRPVLWPYAGEGGYPFPLAVSFP